MPRYNTRPETDSAERIIHATLRPYLIPPILLITRLESQGLFKSRLDCLRSAPQINSANINTIEMIIDKMMTNPVVLLQLSKLYSYSCHTFVHSVNVCLTATIIGMLLELSDNTMKDLALGSLLHDMGKLLIPSEILLKQAQLSPEEWKTIQGHSLSGFELLRPYHQHIPFQAAQVTLQHHENYDSSGYPYGLGGEEIHEYARITAVADVYEALSTDRPYRLKLSPTKVCQIMMESRNVRLDPKIVNVLFDSGLLPYFN